MKVDSRMVVESRFGWLVSEDLLCREGRSTTVYRDNTTKVNQLMGQKTRQSNRPQSRSKRNENKNSELSNMRLKLANFTLFFH